MNNINNFLEFDGINSQLERAKIQKIRLISNIYREYELYLNLIRDNLYISVEKGLKALSCYSLIKGNFLNENELLSLYEKKISKLIYTRLPLITVEQLKINKIEKKINKEIFFNFLGSSSKKNEDEKEKFQYEDTFKFEDPVQFKFTDDISNTYDYYEAENYEKFVSLDLDKNYHINYLPHNNTIENLGIEKQLISSILELMGEVKDENLRHFENHNLNKVDVSPNHQNLKNFDLIDNSLESLLLNLSYNINLELFKANLIKKMISQDSFEYLISKKLMMKHPQPFVINFEFNINQSLSKGHNLPNIVFFNISTVELEFKNLNLSVHRNKINDLKNQFQRLIKKEKYWRQKEISLNKIR